AGERKVTDMCTVIEEMKKKEFNLGITQGITQGISQGITQGRISCIVDFLRNGGDRTQAFTLLNASEQEVEKAEELLGRQ
ncbi:MAG: hypothetical protein NC180_06505, partial [Muribaculaceae bacterium]|nr:hypothetical protein [Roseburia sp.]MCM1429808.1 hypothetical protein [Muribaculaceae bacterium]MCM1492859.1 hypothetical protein [Muribaculaceae bacterium]